MFAFFFSLLPVVLSADSQVFTIQLAGYGGANLWVGTERAEMTGVIDLFTSRLLLYERRCGERRADCAPFSAEGDFAAAYAPPACFLIAPQERPLVCAPGGFEPNASASFRWAGGEWRLQRPHSRPLFGRVARESFWFANSSLKSKPQTAPFEDVEFVSIELGDNHWSEGRPLRLGFGPNDDEHRGFVSLLFDRKRIPAATAVFFSWGGTGGGYLMVGGLNDLFATLCHEWSTPVRSAARSAWALPVERAEASGLSFADINILLGLTEEFTFLPPALVEHLVRAGVFRRSPDRADCSLLVRNDTTAALQLLVGRREFVLPFASFAVTPSDDFFCADSFCCSTVDSAERARYSTDSEWIFGHSALAGKCVALDFEQNTISLSQGRWPWVLGS
ncbi:hypothetical protein M3Y99_00743100 [Aphelenchoides fujianensis]|nr:hypothetical protein M3Y99_00743100 [Aphelenchoides fujianensis]